MTTQNDKLRHEAQQKYKGVRDKLGAKPSYPEFLRETGMSKGRLALIYGRNAYSRLVAECGDQPTAFGQPKSDLRKILAQWGELAREIGGLPFSSDWSCRRLTPGADGLRKVHGIKWAELPYEFLRVFNGDTKWADSHHRDHG